MFTASNGVVVGLDSAGLWTSASVMERGYINVGPDQINALREFFRAEEDERRARWRDPQHPDYFVRRNTQDEVSVHSETSNAYRYIHRNDLKYEGVGIWMDVARAYFDAHPQRNPWEDAKPGEVWRWETEDKSQQALGWVAGDGSWDLIDPRGGFLRAVSRPVSALIEAGFDRFRGEPTANRYVPEEKD